MVLLYYFIERIKFLGVLMKHGERQLNPSWRQRALQPSRSAGAATIAGYESTGMHTFCQLESRLYTTGYSLSQLALRQNEKKRETMFKVERFFGCSEGSMQRISGIEFRSWPEE